MGRSSNRHRNYIQTKGEAAQTFPYRAFPRTTDGVRHPVEVTLIGQQDYEPVYTDQGHVWLDNSGEVVGDQDGMYA